MNQFKFSCPHCEQHLQCEEQASGREIQCPNCRHLIHIPPIPGRTAGYNPESGKTWATFVPSGNVPLPKGISLVRKPDRSGPPRKEPIQ
jgi:DNA-directed RNA polymerase subunit RPC12/RpoP